jgi:hypothetical protein
MLNLILANFFDAALAGIYQPYPARNYYSKVIPINHKSQIKSDLFFKPLLDSL